MLGLIGTVTGMIEVFDVMAIAGTGNVRGMAGGVSRAALFLCAMSQNFRVRTPGILTGPPPWPMLKMNRQNPMGRHLWIGNSAYRAATGRPPWSPLELLDRLD